MPTAFVETAGARLFTRVDGEDASKPWLLVSNSIASDHGMWDGQVALFTRGYRVIRYDARGHGQSSATEGPYDFARLVADAIAVLDHHGVARATVLGLSLGGMTGLGLAITHPDRVGTLVCCDARADSPEPVRQMWAGRIAQVREQGMASVVQATLERWLVASFRAADPAATEKVAAMIRGTSVAGYAGCAAALMGLDYLRDLHRIACPTLFVVGAQDGSATPATMQEMAARVPGARLAVVPEAAHLPNIDNAPGFAAAIGDFLGLK